MTKRKGAARRSSNRSLPQLSDAYIQALKAYWLGDHEMTKALIAKSLENHHIDDTAFCLYRLWIAVLAEEADQGGLKLLYRHLCDAANYSPAIKDVFYSFVTLIHLELDEIEAVQLMLKSLQDAVPNVYLEEVKIRLAMRLREQPPVPAIRNLCDYVFDYVQCELFVAYCSYLKLKPQIKILNLRAETLYPSSPFIRRVELHRALAAEHWNKASKIIKSLHSEFPNERDFVFCFAALEFVRQRFEHGIKAIQRRKSTQSDPDLLALLGACWLAAYQKAPSEKLAEEAERVLTQSIRLYRKSGEPARFPQDQLARLKSMIAQESSQTQPRFWMVKVSAKSFYRLRTIKNQHQSLRKALGADVKAGDVCLIVYEDSMHGDGKSPTWRLGALMSVTSDPQWHPIYRYQSTLKVVLIPEVAVPLDIKEESSAAKLHEYSWEDGRRHGVYSLDEQAIAIIEDSLKFYSEVHEVYERTVESLKIAR